MEMISLFILTVLVVTFSYTYVAGKILDNSEKNMQPLLNIQCGASFGWTLNVCFPLVRHTLYDNFMIIGYGNTKYALKYENITLVTKVPNLVSKTLRYHHNDEALPKRIFMHSKKASDVLEVLRSHSVNIK